jgi:hypothetical protein
MLIRFFCQISFYAVVWLLCVRPAAAGGPPFQFSLGEGKPSVTLGFLAQPQFESITNPNGSGTTNNLYLRRFRLTAGGKLTRKLSYFVESDSPNLGKSVATGSTMSRTCDIFLQDAIVTYTFRPEFQIDGGMLLIPVSHNSGQSAASLLAVDYGPYSFLASDPTHSKNGRDYGVEARGYVMRHFEYRLGAFRGNRDPDSNFPFRVSGRFVWYPFDADTGFFYTGTTLGKKRIVALGTSFDRQDHYSSNAVDLFIDQPLRNGHTVTFQADYVRYDGRGTFPTLPKQSAWMVEGSYCFGNVKLAPFIQAASRDFTNPSAADDRKIQGGMIYWIKGHRLNIKLGIGRSLKNGAPDRTQFVIQTQFGA